MDDDLIGFGSTIFGFSFLFSVMFLTCMFHNCDDMPIKTSVLDEGKLIGKCEVTCDSELIEIRNEKCYCLKENNGIQ